MSFRYKLAVITMLAGCVMLAASGPSVADHATHILTIEIEVPPFQVEEQSWGRVKAIHSSLFWGR